MNLSVKTASCQAHGVERQVCVYLTIEPVLSHLSDCSAQHLGKAPHSWEGSEKTFTGRSPDDESVVKVDWKSPGKQSKVG